MICFLCTNIIVKIFFTNVGSIGGEQILDPNTANVLLLFDRELRNEYGH